MSELSHPEWVNGRRLWMDGPMRDLIHKVRHGDPVKGWEGDDRLNVWWNQPERRFELWRLEDDGAYRFVCRSGPDQPFDDRIVDALLAWDRQRRTRSLHDEIVTHNDAVQTANEARLDEWTSEEIAPRLRHAISKDL